MTRIEEASLAFPAALRFISDRSNPGRAVSCRIDLDDAKPHVHATPRRSYRVTPPKNAFPPGQFARARLRGPDSGREKHEIRANALSPHPAQSIPEPRASRNVPCGMREDKQG